MISQYIIIKVNETPKIYSITNICFQTLRNSKPALKFKHCKLIDIIIIRYIVFMLSFSSKEPSAKRGRVPTNQHLSFLKYYNSAYIQVLNIKL